MGGWVSRQGGRQARQAGGRVDEWKDGEWRSEKKPEVVREVRIYVEIRAIGTQSSSLFRGRVRVEIRRLRNGFATR